MYEEFPDLLTAKQVGEMLGISDRAVYAAADRGTIKGKVPFGKRGARWVKAVVLESFQSQERVPRKRKQE